jgi:murein L,D-transpeptidase YafK
MHLHSRACRVIIRMLIIVVLVCFCGSCSNAKYSETPIKITADKIILNKTERKLYLMSNNEVLKTYKVALGSHPIGPKSQEGDGKTPEGLYVIDRHNPNSSFHLSLHVSYPSPDDLVAAQRAGVRPGGDIMIHGTRNGLGWLGLFHRLIDWTQGCIAVTNTEIDEIWALVPDGTPIEIRP